MSPYQVAAVAAIGGIAALLGLVAFVATGLGVYKTIDHVIDVHDQCRARRRARRLVLDTCEAIHALPTISHPTEDR